MLYDIGHIQIPTHETIEGGSGTYTVLGAIT